MRFMLGSLLWSATLVGAVSAGDAEQATHASHPPPRPLPAGRDRPLEPGPAYFVDPARGNDSWEGTREQPWRTLSHGVTKLAAGETLVLRGGTYYEHVPAHLTGSSDKPITIRAYPGELAVLDGGLREFFDEPVKAWEPDPAGANGEFRSVKTYPELGRETGDGPAVFGNFGDSLVPLQAYRFHGDLASDNPFWNVQNKVGSESFVYCGPGLFYDATSGRIHCRLAHTRLTGLGDDNYGRQTDPRNLPLVVAGGERPVLELRECQNVRLVDLVLRGSRVPTLQIHDSRNIELDGVTAYGGSAAMLVRDTHGLRMQHSACRGIGAPWTFRGMLKYRSVEARLFSASGWDPTGNDNRDFEIRYCEFTDCVDGVFIGNIRGVRFHHNLVENVTDDGVFLTAGTGYDGRTHGGDIHIYQNRFARILTTFAFGVGHGRQKMTEKGKQTGRGVWIYRNVFDFRRPVWYTWPGGPDAPQEITSRGRFASDHGGPTWEPMWIYHNTILAGGTPRYDYGCDGLIHGLARGTSRRVFNNIVCLTEGTPMMTLPAGDADFAGDGNLFWSFAPDKPLTSNPFAKFRASPVYEASKRKYAPGWTTNDKITDPRFASASSDWQMPVDVGPAQDSPAIDAGVAVAGEWPDPVRGSDKRDADIGAIPAGAEAWATGVNGRLDASGNAAAQSPQTGDWAFPPQPAVDQSKQPRALIVAGYPAFDAPIAAYLLRKAGWNVGMTEKAWFDVSQLSQPGDTEGDPYTLLVYDGSLARAKADKTAFAEADIQHVRRYLERGGTLVLMRERDDLFASEAGRLFWDSKVGNGPREKDPVFHIRQPDHPWLKHLRADDSRPPWLAKGSAIRAVGGKCLIGSEIGTSVLHVSPVGQGRLIYIGWSPAASIPHGRMASTVEQERSFEDQVKILQGLLTSSAK